MSDPNWARCEPEKELDFGAYLETLVTPQALEEARQDKTVVLMSKSCKDCGQEFIPTAANQPRCDPCKATRTTQGCVYHSPKINRFSFEVYVAGKRYTGIRTTREAAQLAIDEIKAQHAKKP